jgi:hypothetical protein
MKSSVVLTLLLLAWRQAQSFSTVKLSIAIPISLSTSTTDRTASATLLQSTNRRALFQSAFFTTLVTTSSAAFAIERKSLDDLLYSILRVREATQQESRLITSGKFKDVQRANVKLACKFMLENYRLADGFVQASTYLDGNQKRMEAVGVGQTAVQNLQTVMEYFDSSDVQNIKVRKAATFCDCAEVMIATSVFLLAHQYFFNRSTIRTLHTFRCITRLDPTAWQERRPSF